jgi:hypothetical protein
MMLNAVGARSGNQDMWILNENRMGTQYSEPPHDGYWIQPDLDTVDTEYNRT